MVIVEYCPYGNLQDYLMKYRRRFVDQFSEIDGSLDYRWPSNVSAVSRYDPHLAICESMF